MLEGFNTFIWAVMVALMLWVAATVQKAEVSLASIVERINQHEARIMQVEQDQRFRRGS